MKSHIKGLAVLTMAVVFVAGCKHEPNPPTEQDAIAVWKSTHERTQKTIPIELLSLKKTNGQMQEINGQKVYTLYYEAQQKNLIRLGDHAPGWVQTYQSNYPFQWTEKGWMGPDGQAYPEH
jgi:hypothetical protein